MLQEIAIGWAVEVHMIWLRRSDSSLLESDVLKYYSLSYSHVMWVLMILE